MLVTKDEEEEKDQGGNTEVMPNTTYGVSLFVARLLLCHYTVEQQSHLAIDFLFIRASSAMVMVCSSSGSRRGAYYEA